MHLYLHIPFCARRCSYCDFAIAVRREVPSDAFVDAILKEWNQARQGPPWTDAKSFSTIYLGGGTPSRLAPRAILRLLGTITSTAPLHPRAEVTLEANPEDVSVELAAAWVAAGVNRVSLGAQSFDPSVLRWMHRTHVADEIPRAVAQLRAAGIGNISLDLIYALPTDLERDWSADLEQALALEPDHLSLYGLTVEPHTPLGRWVDRGEARPTPDERYAAEFLLAHERLSGAGYEHYEVSNYARPGKRAVHNTAYWTRAPYLGLGPSAHSASGARRWWNIREWAEWERAIHAGGSTVAGEEFLDATMIQLEDHYLGLRTNLGVQLAGLSGATVALWEGEGWATRAEGRLRLTPEGWLRLDALAATLAGARR